MDNEIKNCPFCGNKPVIEKEMKLCRNERTLTPNYDFEASWSIRCNSCGTSRKAFGNTYYKLCKDGNFEIVPQTYEKDYKGYNDKRQEVIDKWNKRFD